ncbi:hypothetical protein QL285_062540 [Trifolium repens]|nr:hypothetical protein QL285_062540 [Trifolium repens]
MQRAKNKSPPTILNKGCISDAKSHYISDAKSHYISILNYTIHKSQGTKANTQGPNTPPPAISKGSKTKQGPNTPPPAKQNRLQQEGTKAKTDT